jgi:protein TonB
MLNPLSPRNLPGAVLVAAAIHGALYLAVILILGAGFFAPAPGPMIDAEIGYEILDAPPAPTVKVAHVRHQETTPPQPKVKADPTARELHDAKSDVTGTSQASVVKPAQVGSEGQGDANATPFYKIKPKYPRAALLNGDEGWVELKIDVNEKGEVENVRVVGGEKRNLFQNEARRAVEQWKYRPFLDAQGNPVRKADHVVRVNFKMSDNLVANQT